MQTKRFTPSFYEWLVSQIERTDHVGQLARLAKEPGWPKKAWRLNALLTHCQHQQIKPDSLKSAHSEWRLVRERAA